MTYNRAFIRKIVSNNAHCRLCARRIDKGTDAIEINSHFAKSGTIFHLECAKELGELSMMNRNLPYVLNISKWAAICDPFHKNEFETVYIQIHDIDEPFELNDKAKYKEIHRFGFMDVNDDCASAITDEQAREIAGIIIRCSAESLNLVVSCHAGICRSGAVVQAACEYGAFHRRTTHSIPNVIVLKKLRDALGIGYDPSLSPFNHVRNT